ncbi:hypothetical protein LOTGIDRAFT_212018 [Lottia gigantea]|uniref:Dynein regulatory complex subunit 3 n=1 Tax=Lottia gigantea TaxID=225164 RepID=V4B0U5_LOTGI|nr:hypothetical protein LOTGIDRAFT_212018 [Lottia gigantea]ESP03863.1 hypothetical protein LOTGIDRAFT_212018 [Lottia gigantea]
MSRLYDTVEPSVIDEDMLQRAVEEQGPKDEAGKLAKEEGIDFNDVTSLRLDFKNILKIDNLWEFTNLVKLQLDNNIIEKVEGLELLVNLVWLDLSFNNIEVIEGLGTLTKLQDLTLYNNRISRVENMDSLTNLQVLSVGNNQLTELENLIYLRRFRQLKTLNLSGNPFCEDVEKYKQFVVAYLSHLEFLDYRLIDEQSKEAAIDKYQISIDEIQHNERAEERKQEEKQQKEEELKIHTAAYVEYLDGSSLFDSMYSEDSDGQRLNEMPGVDELEIRAWFAKKFLAVCQKIFEYGLTENEKRQAEVNQFWECVEEAKTENKEAGVKILEAFNVERKRVSQLNFIDDKIEAYHVQITELWDKLMGLELQLVDQLEEIIKDFERNMQEMVSMFIENVKGHLTQCRDLENMHHERMMEISIVTLEKVIKNELDEEISEELRMLFVDKDTIIGAVSSSHDLHLLKIDNKEDDIETRIKNWLSLMMSRIRNEEEIKRNRVRVVEVNHQIDQLKDEIDNLEFLQGP